MAATQLGPDKPSRQASDQALPAALPASAFPHSKLDFMGQYEVSMGMIELPRDRVAAALPPGLHLEPITLATQGTHPVLVALGYQINVHSASFTSLPPLNYYESVVAIPSVQLREKKEGYPGPFTWMTRLDVSGLIPLILGRIVGYPKRLSWMRGDDRGYRVTPLLRGPPALRAEILRHGQPGTASYFPHFERMHYLLKLPLISKTDIGAFLFTFFEWEIDTAVLQPCTISLHLTGDFPPLEGRSYEIPGIDQSAAGATWMHVRWVVTAPFARSAIGKMPAAVGSSSENRR